MCDPEETGSKCEVVSFTLPGKGAGAQMRDKEKRNTERVKNTMKYVVTPEWTSHFNVQKSVRGAQSWTFAIT